MVHESLSYYNLHTTDWKKQKKQNPPKRHCSKVPYFKTSFAMGSGKVQGEVTHYSPPRGF